MNTCIQGLQYYEKIVYYSHLIPVFISLILAIIIIPKAKSNSLIKIFIFFIISFCLWLISDLVAWGTIPNYNTVNFAWSILDYINIIFYLLGTYFFIALIKKDGVKSWQKIFLFALSIPAWWITISGQSITTFNEPFCEAFNNDFLITYKLIVESISLLIIVYVGISELIKNNWEKRKQILVVSSALILFFLTFSVTEYISSQTGIYEINLYSLFILPVFLFLIIYAVTNLQIFSLKVIGTQLLAYVMIIMVGSQFFFLDNSTDRTLTLVTFVISLGFGVLLARDAKKEAKQKEEIERLAKTLQVSNERLKELDQQKSEFLSLASHQLRGPLAAIKGYTSLILEGDFGELKKEVRDALETVFRSTQALVVIVGDYLDVSRIDQGKMKYDFTDFNFAELVENVTKELAPSIEAEKKIKFSFNYDKTKDYEIRADMGKIKQVISNLIDNSLKYTKEGEVNVVVQRTPLNKLQFKVSDTGVGIAPETMSKLFERFVRESDASKTNIMGTGLGLYIAKKMIEAHRGKIWAESAGKGKGSAFTIELDPIHSDPDRKFDDVVKGRLG